MCSGLMLWQEAPLQRLVNDLSLKMLFINCIRPIALAHIQAALIISLGVVLMWGLDFLQQLTEMTVY